MLHDGHAVVADFGIARAVTAAAETQESITRTGVSVGTPAYMSPEQATGEEQLDGRSDLFSLGCVLYEMLTGEPAFAAKSAAATIAKRFSYTPPPVTQTRDAVPIPVSQAVARLLERDPEDRPATGAMFIELLTSGAGAAAPPPSVNAKSVAVLPFANLSPDPENEYFADGVTEEIINALARLQGLQVASRTSCFYFKGKHPPLKEVSRELKVATVLTGGVRRAGSRIRITAELVDVASDEHLWSDRYDRQLDDIFEVQDEISRAIAEALQVALGGRAGQRLVEKATANLEAYELYLKGRYFWSQRGPALLKGLDCFKQALALDPNYALAHAGLADSFSLLAFYGLTRPGEAIRQSVAAAKRALELNPALGEAHVSLGFHDMCYRWDWDAAEREYSRALELNPHYTPAWYWRAVIYGFFKWISGADARPAFSDVLHAIQIDPLAWHPRVIHGWILMFFREFDEATPIFRHVLELQPNLFLGHLLLAGTLRHAGKLDEAIAAGQTAVESSGRNPWTSRRDGIRGPSWSLACRTPRRVGRTTPGSFTGRRSRARSRSTCRVASSRPSPPNSETWTRQSRSSKQPMPSMTSACASSGAIRTTTSYEESPGSTTCSGGWDSRRRARRRSRRSRPVSARGRTALRPRREREDRRPKGLPDLLHQEYRVRAGARFEVRGIAVKR